MAANRSQLKQSMLKQYSVGAWPGALKDLLGRTVFYLTPINLFMLAATTYHVTARAFLQQYFPWVNFWMFFGLLVFVVLCAMVAEYKIIYPSTVYYGNIQGYKHGNPVRRDLENIAGEIKRLHERLDEMNARRGGAAE